MQNVFNQKTRVHLKRPPQLSTFPNRLSPESLNRPHPPRTADQPEPPRPHPVLDLKPGYDRVDQSSHERRTHEQVSGLQHTCVRLDLEAQARPPEGREGGGRGHGERAQKAGGGEEPGAQVPGPTQPQPPTLKEQNPTQKWYRLDARFCLFVLFLLFIAG